MHNSLTGKDWQILPGQYLNKLPVAIFSSREMHVMCAKYNNNNNFKKNKCKEKFVILQSIGSETRSVIYTCRYSSGHFKGFRPLGLLV